MPTNRPAIRVATSVILSGERCVRTIRCLLRRFLR
jgi:hypothetical protein